MSALHYALLAWVVLLGATTLGLLIGLALTRKR